MPQYARDILGGADLREQVVQDVTHLDVLVTLTILVGQGGIIDKVLTGVTLTEVHTTVVTLHINVHGFGFLEEHVGRIILFLV